MNLFKKKQPQVRIALDAESFSALVRGGQVTVKGDPEVAIILSDIGFEVMEMYIARARRGVDHYKAHEYKGDKA